MTSSPEFPIIGVGASAGGIEALEGFFQGMPSAAGLAIVIVTHLSPERESLLDEVIGRYTELSVQVAADGMPVEINHVYVLPADAILSIEHRRLQHSQTDRLPRRTQADRHLLQRARRRSSANSPSASCSPAATPTARSASRRSRSVAA